MGVTRLTKVTEKEKFLDSLMFYHHGTIICVYKYIVHFLVFLIQPPVAGVGNDFHLDKIVFDKISRLMYTEVDNLYNGIGAYRQFKAEIRCITMMYTYSRRRTWEGQ